jgi:beta-mannosidase
VDAHVLQSLSTGWQAACTPAGLNTDASELEGLAWRPAQVPGTAAAALRDAGLWRPGEHHDFDAEDWWFRASFDADPVAAGEEVSLRLEGIATVSEVYLNGELLLESDSMFAAHAVDVAGRLRATNELSIRCLALTPLLRTSRRPRARWRTRVADGNLRFLRTTLLGRAPGFAPGPAAVGPWRAVSLERRRRLSIEALRLRPRLEDGDGVLSVLARMRALDGQPLSAVEIELDGPSGTHRAQLELGVAEDTTTDAITVHGELRVHDAATWWPHTHGEPALHDVRLHVSSAAEAIVVDAGRVGFRHLAFGAAPGHDVERDGLELHLNGVRVFARGAVWTPIDSVGLAPPEPALRAALERVREAGMNMLRIPGVGAYETSVFHDLCDELGILVWQDFMFANFDYPIGEASFRAAVEREAADVLDALAGRPSLAVLCGNSEIEQQVAMLGLDPSLGRGELFGELLPALVRASGADALYVPSTPCGGELPFRPGRGIANYYGVGAYLRPLEDARRAGVRFAAECLAFSNVPDESAIEQMQPAGLGALAVDDPGWKAGVPRDVDAQWDFEDVRDHYLQLLFDVEPAELRRVAPERYLELSRMVTGEVMAEVFGEWRRGASPCGGGLVLWLHDLVPGAGWGVIDCRGEPKVAYGHLKRALAPVAVWTADEGLGGVMAHVANDRPTPLTARLRVALYQNYERRVGEAQQVIELDRHSSCEYDVETLLGHFVDASWAYKFGAPAQDVIVVNLEANGSDEQRLLSQSFYFPAGRPTSLETAEHIGLAVGARPLANGCVQVMCATRRLVWGLRVHVPGFIPDDDAFSIEPGHARMLTLRPRAISAPFTSGAITALNLDGRIHFGLANESDEQGGYR